MISRQYLKITSSTKILLFQSLKSTKRQINLQCCCTSTNNLQKYCNTIFSNKFSTSVPVVALQNDNDKTIENTMENNSNDTSRSIQKPTTQEELLEKFIAGLSSDIHQKNRVYKNDVLRILSKIKEGNFSTKRQGLLLLHCCTELLPDESPSSRMNLVEQIWNTLKPHTKFTTSHYNELLRVYIANGRTLNVNSYIQQMSPMKPNITTYELFLQALAEAGDLNQATEVIANMKCQDLPATENIFNSLILCQGKSGNLNNIQEVLTMMKSLKQEKSINTYTAVARALAWNKKCDLLLKEMENAHKNGLKFNEVNIMDIVKTMSLVGLYGVVPQVLRFLPEQTLKTPSISPYMQSVTTLLVFQNHPLAALEIYKCLPLPSFGPKDDQGLHGRSLVRDCVKAALPSGIIALITQELMSSGRNPIAIQNASEAALQSGKVPLALDLFTRMKQMGLPLRTHYFWPILTQNSKTYGEKGVMNTIETMCMMDIKPDYETIINYVLPYVSFTSPQNLMKKFLEHGLTVSNVLTPMMEILASSGQVRAASELSEIFQGKIEGDKLMKPLLKGYLTSLDVKSTTRVLEELTEKSTDKGRDWVGRFLCELANSRKYKEDISDFRTLVMELKYSKLRMSTAATDHCLVRLPNKYKPEILEDLKANLIAITDERLIDDAEMFAQHIPHPSNMNEESLRSHLTELEFKGMNTRGVLRKLLQQYCRDGNLTAAREMLNKCQTEGVFLSAGMKASIFDLYVKLGELDLAEDSLADLNKSAPNFILDEFKIIDFATLMVYRKKLDRAFELIFDQSKNRRVLGGRNIETNCWRLLDAMAANGSPEYVKEMFNTLTTYGYCKPTNVILGPLIRVYLKTDDLDGATKEFVRLANEYNKTPLKHVLLCKILISMSDGQTEDNFVFNENSNNRFNKLVQTVLNFDRQIHGVGDVQLTLIAALAEVGYKKTLRKVLLDRSVKFHPDALMRRCERFAGEKKISALETITECAKDLRHIDVDSIYDLILDVYQREDDTKSALALWNKMQENNVLPTQKFIQNMCSLFKANHKNIPSDMIAHLDIQTRNQILNN